MSAAARFARAPGVVWRLAGDRVLVRRAFAAGAEVDDAADLLGAAAMAWVALDEARRADEVAAEVASTVGPMAGLDVARALDELVAQGFVVEVAP